MNVFAKCSIAWISVNNCCVRASVLSARSLSRGCVRPVGCPFRKVAETSYPHDADIVLATWTGRAHPRAEQRLGRVRADLAADQMAIVILATLFGLSVVLRDGGAGVDHDALLAAVRLLLTGIEPSPARA